MLLYFGLAILMTSHHFLSWSIRQSLPKFEDICCHHQVKALCLIKDLHQVATKQDIVAALLLARHLTYRNREWNGTWKRTKLKNGKIIHKWSKKGWTVRHEKIRILQQHSAWFILIPVGTLRIDVFCRYERLFNWKSKNTTCFCCWWFVRPEKL